MRITNDTQHNERVLQKYVPFIHNLLGTIEISIFTSEKAVDQDNKMVKAVS